MMRQQQRELRKTNRELERDRGGLERQERQIVSVGGQCEEGEEKVHVGSDVSAVFNELRKRRSRKLPRGVISR